MKHVMAVAAGVAAGMAAGSVPAGPPELKSEGLHGYVGFDSTRPPEKAEFSAGIGFYSAVWTLTERPLANFQIGLTGTWILPDNSDNKDRPLAPEGTLARTWKERGPTWASVFQTVEGGLGYWAGNHFRYGPPKFSMNATPQCYDYEVGSPGWSFFYSDAALPDDRLGIAQLSNRLLIPPDGLPFEGRPDGEFLGYAWMALPFTDAEAGVNGGPPTGEQSWTCFLSAGNFKGPIGYYIPETWSKMGGLFKEPFLDGRGLDARPCVMGGGAMEINTVPRLDGVDGKGAGYTRIPGLRFPVDGEGRTVLIRDVTYFSKAALAEGFRAWRDGGAACAGRFEEKGAWRSTLTAVPTRYTQGGKEVVGVDAVMRTKVYPGGAGGLEWPGAVGGGGVRGRFPEYFRHEGEKRVVASGAPEETGLAGATFPEAGPGREYTAPDVRAGAGAWGKPGPVKGPFTARLADGSEVTYWWYRFVDQPSFQQYRWGEAKRARLQALAEKVHRAWGPEGEYMPGLAEGSLVRLDAGLMVSPPAGLEAGYVPIVTGQRAGR